ncbi:MAG: hypothetical protein LWX54_16580 [Deltaproteobacteria bacterium]|jgi:hypothetical protein|nr:hypothetical protein [Deltaproteobacteria bacterium]
MVKAVFIPSLEGNHLSSQCSSEKLICKNICIIQTFAESKAKYVRFKKRRIGTKFKEYTIEIFQWKQKKRIALAAFYTGENGWELSRC